MDALLDPATGDYAGVLTDTIANAIYLRLMTPLGSYWADPTLGSRLHELVRQKDLPQVGVLARQYAEQALAPLVADGRARTIAVATEQANGRLRLTVTVQDGSGRINTFNYFVRVS